MVGTTPTVRPESRMASRARAYSSTVSKTARPRGGTAAGGGRWRHLADHRAHATSSSADSSATSTWAPSTLGRECPEPAGVRPIQAGRRFEREAPGQSDQGVVGGQLAAVSGHRPQHPPVSLHRVPVAPGRRTGQGLARAQG